MKTIAVINYKGGVGKTSVTANLAASLAAGGFRVLLVDMDPQASLTFSFIKPEEWRDKFQKTRTLKVWFDSIIDGSAIDLSKLIFTPSKAASVISRRSSQGRLDLIASDLGLINVDLDLATELGGASQAKITRNFLKVHRLLSEGLKDVNANSYDIVLLDCPPNFNIVTKNAIAASEKILIPAKPDYLSTLGIDYLYRSLTELVTEFNRFADGNGEIHPEVLGVVFTMIDVRSGSPISALRPFIRQTEKLGLPVFEQKLRENKTIYADAPQYGIPVSLLSPSNATHRTVVEELNAFKDEFVQKAGL